jgi:hypothetical protein
VKSNESTILSLRATKIGSPEANNSAIPPVEDLFDIATDQIDFMSAQSFPASDPPSHSPPTHQED